MADLTITISNRLSLLGGSLSTLWGNTGPRTMTWGVSYWGSTDEVVQDVDKLLANTLVFDDAMQISPEHVFFNTLTLSCAITTEYLTNGIWYKIFTGNVSNAHNRVETNYAEGVAASSTYSMVTSPTTVWS